MLFARVAQARAFGSCRADRHFAPQLPYRPALYAGWPTIEHCEVVVPFPGDPPSPGLSTCEVLNEHNGVLELGADGDGHADHFIRSDDPPRCLSRCQTRFR